MNWESNPVLDNHLRQIDIWEQASRRAFYSTDAEAHLMSTFVLEALAEFTHQNSGKAWPDQTEAGLYSGGLVVSFIRTHFIVVKCAEQSHLIEGTTLLRKQVELLARLNEIDSSEDTFDKLIKKTPHMRALAPGIKNLYGLYSEIAHSSTPDHFHLMGYGEKDEHKGYTSVYPKFSRNSYVLLSNAAQVLIGFWVWLENYNEQNGQRWDLAEFSNSIHALSKVMLEWDVLGDGGSLQEVYEAATPPGSHDHGAS